MGAATSAGPPLTVLLGSAVYSYPAGREVTVGRSAQCDIGLDDPTVAAAVSRVHLVLAGGPGGWVATDRSRNGIYLNGTRVPAVTVTDGMTLAIGAPDGPRLTFWLPKSAARPSAPPPPAPALAAPTKPVPTPVPPPARPVAGQPWSEPDMLERVTGVVRGLRPEPAPPPGAVTIGRGEGNTVLVDDPLTSRLHATMTPAAGGMEITDHHSSNGTFVNGQRITRALLRPGDIVTIGNADFTLSGATLVPVPSAAGLIAERLGLTIDGHQLLTDVSFSARPGTVTAVIGPSGAGKSTLIRLLGGITAPTVGAVGFEGRNVHADYAAMRSRIGLVPQDDVVHRQLTVEQALRYAAELRLPSDTTAADRDAVVDRVLAELELTAHRGTRVDKLSGGQRKRASVAMELLTGPSLLILDEPTSGLDPALDRQVMSMLRALADAGRVVVVVTHSLTYLGMCDLVLLLAPGGKTAYAGPPAGIGAAMGTTDWADIFARVSLDPDGVHRAFLAKSSQRAPAAAPPAATGPAGSPARTSLWRQVWMVARRQVRLIVADRGYFVFLAVLPFVLGMLSLVVPGGVGLGVADQYSKSPNEPAQILILLNIAAVFMGTALTIRDLVGERPIFAREQAVGLSAAAYLAAKIGVYSLAALAQTAILTAIVLAGKGGPTRDAVLLGSATVELYVTLAATAIVSAILGLALSSLARSTEQILPMLVVVIMISIVFSGGLIPVTGRTGLDQLSWLLPARWGFAASAATADLRAIAPFVPADETLWSHSAPSWLFDMAMLIAFGVVLARFVRWRLRLRTR